MILLFIIGIIGYGFARATQQALIFMERNREPRHSWLDEPSEIHLAGWFEPICLILSATALTFIAQDNFYKFLYWIPAYFIYWLPYAETYCYLRRKDWFESGQIYTAGNFFRFRLLSKTASKLCFIFATLILISIEVLDYLF